MAVAFGARHRVHERGHPLLQARRGVVERQVRHIGHDAGKLAEEARVFGVFDAGEVVAAVEDGVQGLVAELGHRRVEREAVVAPHEFHLAVYVVCGRVLAHHLYGAVAQALARVGDELLHVYLRHLAQTVAVRARAVGRVERECIGLRLGVGEARVRVHQHAAEVAHRAVLVVEHHQHPFALAEGRLHSLAQAAGVAVGAQPVHHQLYVMHLVAVHLHLVCNLLHLAVHSHLQKSLLGHLLEELAVVALASLHQRRQHHDVAAAVLAGDNLQYLLLAVLHHGLAALYAVGLADAGVEQTQQVVGVGQRAHRGARVVVGALLLDGDDR